MSSKKSLIFSVLTVIVLFGAACSGSQPGTQGTFDPDDPDNPQMGLEANAWGETLQIEPGNFVEQEGEFADFILRMRVNRTGEGALGIAFHADPQAGAYILLMEDGRFTLQREVNGQIVAVAVYEFEFESVEWHQLEIEMLGSDIRVFHLDRMVIEYADPAPLPPGGLSFETMGDLAVVIEHLDLEHLGEQAAQNDETSTEPEKEETSQPADDNPQAPSALPLSELSWVRLGGPPGGTGYDIRYKFDDPHTWYVTDANAGVHISTDNGLTWSDSNDGLPGLSGPTSDAVGIFCLTIDPHDPDIIWIGTIGQGHIYRSIDGGKNWEERENGIQVEYDQLTFRGFTIDPRSSDIVYAMAETNSEELGGPKTWLGGVGGVVYKTIDAGENWSKIWDGGMPSSLTRYLWINPDNPDVLYVSTGIFDRSAVGEAISEDDPFGGLGILKSTDGGQTWRILNQDNGLRNLYIGSLYMHPENPEILLAAVGHGGGPETLPYWEDLEARGLPSPMGVYRTTDGGENWIQTLAANEREIFSSVELCPSDANIGYAATRISMYRTADAGVTWELTARPWSPPGISAGFPIDMQCDPLNVDRVFVNNYGGGNFLSEDGGKSWIGASTGYTGAQVFELDFDPDHPARIYTMSFSGLWRSDDGGVTWIGIRYGPEGFDAYRTIAVDPENSSHIFSGQYGFIESWDGGLSWSENWDISSMFDQNISLESTLGGIPTFAYAPSDPNRIYVGFSHELCALNHEPACSIDNSYQGPVMMVSSDGGSSWNSAVDNTLMGRDIRSVSVDSFNPDIAYAATDLGVYKTVNAGDSWTELTAPTSNSSAYAVAVDPGNSNQILVSIDRDGLYRSTDGGQTWKNASAGLEPNGSVSTILFDPSQNGVVYVSDFLSGVYQSTDSASTWTKINTGLHSRAISSMVISGDGNHLYAGSNEDGVYRLDLNSLPPLGSDSD